MKKKELTGLEPESSEHWSDALVSSGIGAEEFDASFPGCMCVGGEKASLLPRSQGQGLV